MAGSALVHARAGQARESELRVLGKGHGGGKVRRPQITLPLRRAPRRVVHRGGRGRQSASHRQ